jgi:glycosyltransferase involved in cell wall biosynthesis
LNFLREKPSHICRRNLRRIQAVIDRAAAVTTISHFVANEIRRHLDLRGKPLRVIYNGANTDDYPQAARPEFADARPFLFAISDIVRKKNFHVLVGLIARLPEYRLIIAGNDRTDYAREIRRAAAEAGVAERVCLPGIVSDAARCWLYKNCSGVCFPSLTEGFGLPVVEAMLFGRPVFISDATSLPEVGGPLAFYWKCFDPDAMLAVFRCGMAAYAADPQYAARLTAHAERFSWNKAAAEYLAFYREIIDAGGRLSRRAA